ncbi:MAG: type II toxin-antitoxin system RelE/ParE family toxin [Rhodocyclaceae bacterium]|nr:type II toxin-antitoxin system RelE/ParE family toxin [Rhodocyclaceae bacterium]
MSAWFARFARKHSIGAQELNDAVHRALSGLIDADLGGGVIKQRLPRPGEGRARGYRLIMLFSAGQRSVFVYGYTKSNLDNIGPHEQSQFRKMARHVLELTETQLDRLVANHQFEEVHQDDQQIPR